MAHYLSSSAQWTNVCSWWPLKTAHFVSAALVEFWSECIGRESATVVEREENSRGNTNAIGSEEAWTHTGIYAACSGVKSVSGENESMLFEEDCKRGSYDKRMREQSVHLSSAPQSSVTSK